MHTRTRMIDKVGRFVLPSDYRQKNGIKHGTPMVIYTDGDAIILEKQPDTCRLCGTDADLIEAITMDQLICRECLDEFNRHGREAANR